MSHEGDPQATAGVREGEVLAGKYRVERVLGVGGMGVVVAAHHIQLDERVALKFLLPDALRNPEAVGRFIREARAAVKIKSEHVARVSDVGTLESGSPYMVMEYLEGSDLADWLQKRGAMPIDQAVDFVLQACVAVADAHALGIVHRDLKPANLFCVRRSDGHLSIKVLDFGISKLTNLSGSGNEPSMTRTSAMMGTPLYMSPEQMRSSRDVDAGTDIWALGAILHELMVGKPAFFAESLTELAIRVANDPPPPLRAFRSDAPVELEAVVLRCLEKDRNRRYRNVGQLAVALLPFAPPHARASVDRIAGIVQASGLSVGTVNASGAAAGPPSFAGGSRDGSEVSAGTMPPVGRTTLGGTRGKAAAFGGGALALLAAGAAAAFFVVSRKPAPPAEPPQAAAQAVPAAPSSPAGLPVASASAPTPSAAPAALAKVADLPPAPSQPPVVAAAAAPPAPAARPGSGHREAPPSRGPAPAVAAAPAAAAPAPAAKPAAANCDPPYYFDARGNRAFKPECL